MTSAFDLISKISQAPCKAKLMIVVLPVESPLQFEVELHDWSDSLEPAGCNVDRPYLL